MILAGLLDHWQLVRVLGNPAMEEALMSATPFEQLANLDRLVHDPARLAILTALSACERADFLFLLRITGLTKGNLSSHLSKLEEAGMVEIEKRFVEKKTQTLVRLSDRAAGRSRATGRRWRSSARAPRDGGRRARRWCLRWGRQLPGGPLGPRALPWAKGARPLALPPAGICLRPNGPPFFSPGQRPGFEGPGPGLRIASPARKLQSPPPERASARRRGRRVAYAPIENYGVIGNMRTAALVGKHGSIDWYCFPHFDSPSVFAAILDDEQGGRFEIAPVGDGVGHQAALLAGHQRPA